MTAPVASTLVLAALGGLLLAAPAQAGGCYGSECYRRVVMPPVYDTVQETVLVRPTAPSTAPFRRSTTP